MITIGPLRVADAEVFLEVDDPEIAEWINWSFQDLFVDAQGFTAQAHHLLAVRSRNTPWRHYGIWRNGVPCETLLEEGYVLFHLQWEINRIALERTAASIHAAAVEIDGRCVVLCGSSMSGKTTLAGWMSIRGSGYVADEIVALDAEGHVLPYHRPLGLRHGGPLNRSFDVPANLHRRFQEYEMLVPVSQMERALLHTQPAPICAIVFPTYVEGATTELTALNSSEAFVKICDNSPGLFRHGEPVFTQLASVVRASLAVSMRSSNLASAESALRALVAEKETA